MYWNLSQWNTELTDHKDAWQNAQDRARRRNKQGQLVSLKCQLGERCFLQGESENTDSQATKSRNPLTQEEEETAHVELINMSERIT